MFIAQEYENTDLKMHVASVYYIFALFKATN